MNPSVALIYLDSILHNFITICFFVSLNIAILKPFVVFFIFIFKVHRNLDRGKSRFTDSGLLTFKIN